MDYLKGLKIYHLWSGVAIISVALIFVYLGISQDNDNLKIFSQWLTSIGIATISLGIAYHSLMLFNKSDKRIKDLEQKEIQRKLYMFQEENNCNMDLIQDLIARKKNFVRQDVLDAQLEREKEGEERLRPTPKEIQIISEGKFWIPKEEFSYDYALQVVELSHHLKKTFIDKIKEYIAKGKKLNAHKDFCQQWIIARRGYSLGETKDYYTSLTAAKRICDDMKKIIENEYKK